MLLNRNHKKDILIMVFQQIKNSYALCDVNDGRGHWFWKGYFI